MQTATAEHYSTPLPGSSYRFGQYLDWYRQAENEFPSEQDLAEGTRFPQDLQATKPGKGQS